MNLRFSKGNGVAIKSGKEIILLDPKVSDFFSFVSHAHEDHVPYHIVKKPYCSEETYELAKLRHPDFKANVAKENKEIKFDNFSAKLINSGHILGSTQTLLNLDGTSVLYTGDFKTEEGLTTKKIDVPHADILITETTFGHPNYRFPPAEHVRKNIVKWAQEETGKGFSVSLGGYPLGKSQEAIKLLNNHDIVPSVSDTIRKYCEVYEKFGVKMDYLENGEEANTFVKPMHVVLQSKAQKNMKNCVLTGWALTENFGVKGFPMSDHCDFKQLLEFVERVNPKKVYCIHGFNKVLAKEIHRKFKIPALSLEKREQKLLTEFG